jgi:uncharacterized Fe-S center protein
MSSEVYFAQRRATQGAGLLEKLEQLFDAAGIGAFLEQGDLAAIKLTFPESGNTTSVRAPYAARVAGKLRQYGASPFLTDSHPFLPHRAGHGLELLSGMTRLSFGAVEAPLLMADGLCGRDELLTPVPQGRHFKEIALATALAQADAIVSLCHLTGHPAWGFAGALWNLGFGAASQSGKLAILSAPRPGSLERVMHQASDLVLQEKLVESLAGLVALKSGKIGYITLLLDLIPHPDDQPFSDAAIAPDIGILASLDPVAIDQAAIDLLNQAPGLSGTRLSDPASADKIKDLFPLINWEHQLNYAQQLGLGKRDYELMII